MKNRLEIAYKEYSTTYQKLLNEFADDEEISAMLDQLAKSNLALLNEVEKYFEVQAEQEREERENSFYERALKIQAVLYGSEDVKVSKRDQESRSFLRTLPDPSESKTSGRTE